MAGGNIDIRLNSRSNLRDVRRAKEEVESFGAAIKKVATNLARGAVWKLGADAVSAAFSTLKNTVKEAFSSAFRFESTTTQFKTLIGNIDEAKAHMADLKELGDTPPFSLDQFATASKALMVMTDGALGYKKSLELIGDAAAATGRPIEEMGQAVGRLYAFIRDGQPLSRAVMQLRNMGVITPEVAQKLQDMQAAGESNVAIWNEVETALGRYNGAMKELESTGEGLMGAIKSQWNNIVRAFGQAMQDDAKGGMKDVLDTAKELQEDGSVETWATTAAAAMGKVARAVGSVVGAISKVINHLKAGRDAWHELWGGKEEEGGDEETFELDREEEVNAYTRKRYLKGSNGSEHVETIVDEAKKREHEKRMREAEEEARKREALEEGDRKRAEKAAQEQAEAEAKAAEKAAADRAKVEADIAKEVAKERERLEKQLHQQRMADLRAEGDELRKQMEQASEKAQGVSAVKSAAQSEFDHAFAAYRDPEKAAELIGEDRDYAADLDRLHKDARRYGGKWRIDELSALMSRGDTQGVSDTLAQWRKSKSFTPEVEAMVRASAAEQTKTTAEDELRKISANTEGLAQKIETLTETISTEKSDLSAINGNTGALANKIDELLSVK